MLNDTIKEFLNLQKLGYVATVSPNNMPNISPKGTIIVWDEHTLAFANINSPNTITNIQLNPNVEINVIDPVSRKGYLFGGQARIITNGISYDKILNYYRTHNIKSPIKSIVLVTVSNISKVQSPLYDMGHLESDITSKWKKHFQNL